MFASIAVAILRDYSLKNVSTVDERRIIDMGVSDILSMIALVISVAAFVLSIRWTIQCNRQKRLDDYKQIFDFLSLLPQNNEKARQARMKCCNLQDVTELRNFEVLYGKELFGKLPSQLKNIRRNANDAEYQIFLSEVKEKYNNALKSAYKTW